MRSSCLWDAKHKRDACVLVPSLGKINDTHEYIVTIEFYFIEEIL